MMDEVPPIPASNQSVFDYPAKGAQYAAKGISAVWNFFWRDVIDIPQFPVQGKVFGQSHWEEITVRYESQDTAERSIQVSIRKQDNASWKKVFYEVNAKTK